MNDIKVIDETRDSLIKELSEQYSHNSINMEEYERILDYLHKVETKKELAIIARIIRENSVESNDSAAMQDDEMPMLTMEENHLSLFSWRTTNLKSINGSGGTYTSLFGTNRIIVDSLPRGRTVLNVNSIFGLTEIIVPENIKIVNKAAPIFGGIFAPSGINRKNEGQPELYITGAAIFGNITIVRK
jgi:hypothetical protein